jgi:hypothetical protein
LLDSERERTEAVQAWIYEGLAPLMRFLSQCGIPIPTFMRATAEVVLNSLLRGELDARELNLRAIESLLDDVRASGASLDTAALEIVLRRNVEKTCLDFFELPRDLERLRRCRESVAAAKSLPLPLPLWSIQNRCYGLLETIYLEMQQNREVEWVAGFEHLAALLSLRV